MPIRRNYRRTRRPRRRTRRRTRRTFRRRTTRRRRVVPNTKSVTLRYTSYIDLDPSASTPFVYQTFRANSIYDPDFTGGGHQPFGYDQWSAFYAEWVVTGSKCSFRALSADVNAPGMPAFYGVSLNQSPIGSTGWGQTALIEQPDTSWRLIQTGPNSQPARPAVSRYSPRRWWGIKDIGDNFQFWGQTASNPTTESFFNVWAASADGTSNIGSLRGIVTIDYRVRFMNSNNLGQS